MRIAAICPVGPLDQYGYQHFPDLALRSMSPLCDRVYMYSSTRDQPNVDQILADAPNVIFFSSANTWFVQDETGKEVYDPAKGEQNANAFLRHAKADGMDVCVLLCINQYVPAQAVPQLRAVCQRMLDTERPFEWLYKRYQLGDRLFHADTRLPWILNLTIQYPFCVKADSVESPDGLERHTVQSGCYDGSDASAVVDCAMELSRDELESKMNFVRCNSQCGDQTQPTQTFSWGRHFPYYCRKFSAKRVSSDRLDSVGQEIVQRSQPEFVSWAILDALRQESYSKAQTPRDRHEVGEVVEQSANEKTGTIAQNTIRRLRTVWHGLHHAWRLRRLAFSAGRGEVCYREYLKLQLRRTILKRNAPLKARTRIVVDKLATLQDFGPSMRVLCIGCRNQSEIAYFQGKGADDVTGIDLWSASPEILIMDMHCMSFADDQFDVIYASHSLEHAFDIDRVVREIVRVAKDGALVAIEVPTHYVTGGADRIDFRDAAGVRAKFGRNVGALLWSQDLEQGNSQNDTGTCVARTIFRMKKP